jgi:Tol biopolymer transport system component
MAVVSNPRFPTTTLMRVVCIGGALVTLTVCGGGDSAGPGPPNTTGGSIVVTVSTTGTSLDPDGYTVVIGSRQSSVGTNAAITLTEVEIGSRTLQLTGIAPNCIVAGGDQRNVNVVAGQTAQLAFQLTCIAPGAELIAFNTERNGNSEIYLMSTDGTGLFNLTNSLSFDANPAWSPDGSKIAFTTNRAGNLDVYVMNMNGTGLVYLASFPREEYLPAWSPYCTKIAFVRDVGGSLFLEVAVMNANGSNPVDISNGPDFVQRPAWAPDGSRIAFGTDRDFETSGFTEQAFEIYSVKPDGSDARNLTNHDTADDNFPAWSPDGSKIAFHSDRTGRRIYDIFVMGANGGAAVNLTNNSGGNFLPAWSRDGSRIAFESDRDGNAEIYVMKADGSGLVRLTSSPGVDSFPAWRP